MYHTTAYSVHLVSYFSKKAKEAQMEPILSHVPLIGYRYHSYLKLSKRKLLFKYGLTHLNSIQSNLNALNDGRNTFQRSGELDIVHSACFNCTEVSGTPALFK